MEATAAVVYFVRSTASVFIIILLDITVVLSCCRVVVLSYLERECRDSDTFVVVVSQSGVLLEGNVREEGRTSLRKVAD